MPPVANRNACVFWVGAHVKDPCLATLALWGPPELPAVATGVPGTANCLRAAPGGQCPMDRWGSKTLAKEKVVGMEWVAEVF